MAQVDVLKSYLVSLGFEVNHPQLRKFEDALRSALQTTEKVTTGEGGIASLFVKTGASVIATLAGIATGTAALIDHVANADLSFQIMARQMFMTTDAARGMKIATDALGVSIQDVIWGPKELQDRYLKLVDEQKRIEGGFGGGVEQRLKKIRDLTFEFTKLQVAATELSRGFAVSLFEKLFGDGKGQERLHNFVEYIINNIPRIADEVATALAPILKDTYQIFVSLVAIAKDATSVMLEFIGAIYGDQKLAKGEVNIRNIGSALEHVANTMKVIVGYMQWLIDAITAHPMLSHMLAGGAAGAIAGSVIPGIGTLGGAAIGIVGGGLLSKRYHEADAGSLADQAKQIAAQISAATGVSANLVYGQFAHETGNFTNRGATQLNNLAGINVPGGNGSDYRSFSSLQDFAKYYEGLIESSRYSGAASARTPAEFAHGLKAGGWYTGPESAYASGVSRGSEVYMGGVTINIVTPNATPDQIQRAVAQGVKDANNKDVQRNLQQLSGAYS